jgi:hypothetical protein
MLRLSIKRVAIACAAEVVALVSSEKLGTAQHFSDKHPRACNQLGERLKEVFFSFTPSPFSA